MALRVGLIGVNPDRGWARESHVPAVQALPGLDLVAVASRRQEAAERAAQELGVARGYGDPLDLVADPSVDIVGVAASVPAHRELLEAAARAGKHVYSEWPLGVDVGDADGIADAVSAAGVRSTVGLQARENPATRAAAELLAGGALGRILSVSAVSTTAGFGAVVPAGEWYLEEPATGMHLVSIQTAHTLDLVHRVLGPWERIAAQFDVQFPLLQVEGQLPPARRVLPDHVLVTGRAGGVPAQVRVLGGRPAADTPFLLEILGDRGTLRLRGGAPRGFQAGTLVLELNGEPVAVEEGELGGLAAPVMNVAATWAALRDDITTGSRRCADVDHARHVTRLIEALRTSDATGRQLSIRTDGHGDAWG